MKAHLKNIEGVMPIVSQLRVLCGEHIEVNTFSNFIQVEIKTGLESHIVASGIVQINVALDLLEKRYGIR